MRSGAVELHRRVRACPFHTLIAPLTQSDVKQGTENSVRKGAGTDQENSSQVMQAKDAHAVLDGWAKDMATSYQSLRK